MLVLPWHKLEEARCPTSVWAHCISIWIDTLGDVLDSKALPQLLEEHRITFPSPYVGQEILCGSCKKLNIKCWFIFHESLSLINSKHSRLYLQTLREDCNVSTDSEWVLALLIGIALNDIEALSWPQMINIEGFSPGHGVKIKCCWGNVQQDVLLVLHSLLRTNKQQEISTPASPFVHQANSVEDDCCR